MTFCKEMKILNALAYSTVLAIQSCTIADYKTSHDDTKRIRSLVKEGDNIREARELLIENGFTPSEIRKNTASESSYSFTLTLTEPTELDYLSEGFDLNLNPWRNGIEHWIAFKAGIDEAIFRIYTD